MVNKKRRRIVQEGKYDGGPVVYWMNRECRLHDNWAFSYAADRAKKHKVPLLVVYNLAPSFLGGGYRQHVFKLRGLQEVAELARERNIPFFIVRGDGADVGEWATAAGATLLITDMSPLTLQRHWLDQCMESFSGPITQIDAHNIIPVWVASDKEEYAARTIRPKIHRLIDDFLEPVPRVLTHPYSYSKIVPVIDWDGLIGEFKDKHTVPVVDWITPGEAAGKRAVREFVRNGLARYAEDRNNPLADGQSNLSPYLHYGQIAPAAVVESVVEEIGKPPSHIVDKGRNGASTTNNAAAFLEEIVVRRELSDNFCWYNTQYDSPEGFPDWAKESLRKHEKDKRQYVYSFAQFRDADTHDALWNACQREMLETGKMHGYMRMYWAKKILEWTPDAHQAMEIAIALNDTYELDGRDPNGYAGIAWSIGGVHDRGWTERAVFGKVRYMTEQAVKRRCDPSAYIAKFSGQGALL